MKSKCALFTIASLFAQCTFGAQPRVERYQTSPFLTPTVRVSSTTSSDTDFETSSASSQSTRFPNCPENSPYTQSRIQSRAYTPETSPELPPKKIKIDPNYQSIPVDLQESLQKKLQVHLEKLENKRKHLIQKFCTLHKIDYLQFKNQIDYQMYAQLSNFDWRMQNSHNNQYPSVQQIYDQFSKHNLAYIQIRQNDQEGPQNNLFNCYAGLLEFDKSFTDNELIIRNAAVLCAIQYYKNNSDQYLLVMDSIQKQISNDTQSTILHRFKQCCITQAQLLALLSIATEQNKHTPTDWNTAMTTYQTNNPSLKRYFTEFSNNHEPMSPFALPAPASSYEEPTNLTKRKRS